PPPQTAWGNRIVAAVVATSGRGADKVDRGGAYVPGSWSVTLGAKVACNERIFSFKASSLSCCMAFAAILGGCAPERTPQVLREVETGPWRYMLGSSTGITQSGESLDPWLEAPTGVTDAWFQHRVGPSAKELTLYVDRGFLAFDVTCD